MGNTDLFRTVLDLLDLFRFVYFPGISNLIDIGEESHETVRVIMKFTFTMESLVVELYKGGSKDVSIR